MIFVSHDLALVAEVAHNITVMYAGQVIEQGAHQGHPYQPDPRVHSRSSGFRPVHRERAAPLHQVPGAVPTPRDFPKGDRFAPRSSHPEAVSDVRPGASSACPATDHYYAELPDEELERLGIDPLRRR